MDKIEQFVKDSNMTVWDALLLLFDIDEELEIPEHCASQEQGYSAAGEYAAAGGDGMQSDVRNSANDAKGHQANDAKGHQANDAKGHQANDAKGHQGSSLVRKRCWDESWYMSPSRPTKLPSPTKDTNAHINGISPCMSRRVLHMEGDCTRGIHSLILIEITRSPSDHVAHGPCRFAICQSCHLTLRFFCHPEHVTESASIKCINHVTESASIKCINRVTESASIKCINHVTESAFIDCIKLHRSNYSMYAFAIK